MLISNFIPWHWGQLDIFGNPDHAWEHGSSVLVGRPCVGYHYWFYPQAPGVHVFSADDWWSWCAGHEAARPVQSLMPSRPVFFQFGVATYHWLSTILRQLKSVNVYVAVAWCEHTLQLRYRATCIPCCHIRPNSPLLISLAFYLTILFIHYVPTSRKFLLGQLRRRRRRDDGLLLLCWTSDWPLRHPASGSFSFAENTSPLPKKIPKQDPFPPSEEDPPLPKKTPPPSEEDPPHPYPIDAVWPTPQWFTMTGSEALGRVAMGYVTVCWSWDVMGWKVKWWDLTGCT